MTTDAADPQAAWTQAFVTTGALLRTRLGDPAGAFDLEAEIEGSCRPRPAAGSRPPTPTPQTGVGRGLRLITCT